MKVFHVLFGMAWGVALGACSAHEGETAASGARQALAGAQAAGSVPKGLPSRVLVGLFEDTGGTWMKASGARWDVRYRYFTKGWANNWGWGAYDGSWGLGFMQESDGQGFVPAVQYYQMHGEAGGSESAFYAKTQNAATMRSYFGDFKLLMQRAKDFGKPVVVLLEADGFAFLQRQSGGSPNAPAAVATTGMPELSSLPNTVAGWGLAFLQIKKAVGAGNAVLGIHVSAWASDKDIAYSNFSAPLGPEVDKVHAFLAPLGLGPNVTGTTFDVLVGDPLDRDSDFYRLTTGEDRWWSASDADSINSKSFNRYAEWLRLWNLKSSKRWVLWQIPLGNSNHLNVANAGAARQGYKDNRTEYFFNTPSHIAKFADSGVIALLFGAGAGGLSSYQNDVGWHHLLSQLKPQLLLPNIPRTLGYLRLANGYVTATYYIPSVTPQRAGALVVRLADGEARESELSSGMSWGFGVFSAAVEIWGAVTAGPLVQFETYARAPYASMRVVQAGR